MFKKSPSQLLRLLCCLIYLLAVLNSCQQGSSAGYYTQSQKNKCCLSCMNGLMAYFYPTSQSKEGEPPESDPWMETGGIAHVRNPMLLEKSYCSLIEHFTRKENLRLPFELKNLITSYCEHLKGIGKIIQETSHLTSLSQRKHYSNLMIYNDLPKHITQRKIVKHATFTNCELNIDVQGTEYLPTFYDCYFLSQCIGRFRVLNHPNLLFTKEDLNHTLVQQPLTSCFMDNSSKLRIGGAAQHQIQYSEIQGMISLYSKTGSIIKLTCSHCQITHPVLYSGQVIIEKGGIS